MLFYLIGILFFWSLPVWNKWVFDQISDEETIVTLYLISSIFWITFLPLVGIYYGILYYSKYIKKHWENDDE